MKTYDKYLDESTREKKEILKKLVPLPSPVKNGFIKHVESAILNNPNIFKDKDLLATLKTIWEYGLDSI